MKNKNEFLKNLSLSTVWLWLVLIFIIGPFLIFSYYLEKPNETAITVIFSGILTILLITRYVTQLLLWALSYVLEEFPKTLVISHRTLLSISVLLQLVISLWGAYHINHGYEVVSLLKR